METLSLDGAVWRSSRIRDRSTDLDIEALNRRTDAALNSLRPRTPEGRWKIARAREFRAAQTAEALRRALARSLPDISREETVQVNGGTGATTRIRTYRDGRRPVLRVIFSEDIGKGITPIAYRGSVASCSDYPPGTPDEDLPMECVEGYDPNYNSTSDEAKLVAMEAEEQDIEIARDGKDREYEMEEEEEANTTVTNAIDESADAEVVMAANLTHADGLAFGTSALTFAFALARSVHLNPISACETERAAYNAAVGTFVAAAATTMFWILRRNPGKAAGGLKAVGAALAGVYVADVALDECMAEAEM